MIAYVRANIHGDSVEYFRVASGKPRKKRAELHVLEHPVDVDVMRDEVVREYDQLAIAGPDVVLRKLEELQEQSELARPLGRVPPSEGSLEQKTVIF